MRLTVEEDRETIKRYGHIPPARGWGVARCSAICPGTLRACTLAKGHRGPHVAHSIFKKVVAVWDADPGAQAPGRRLRTSGGARAQISAWARGRVGLPGALWGHLVRGTSSMEEIVFLIMFIAFVGFGIDWLLKIFG